MSRYFLEVCYLGAGYAGFQVQENAMTIQGELENALKIFLRRKVTLTGSSRTDSGVHARQNYFHFDIDELLDEKCTYNLNALLPPAIAVKNLHRMHDGAHCRFDAMWREYSYLVYAKKDPFIRDVGYYFPYTIDVNMMNKAAEVVKEYTHFEAFSKRNTQVKTFTCTVMESHWVDGGEYRIYKVRSNRFLRGMVRGLVGTMLQVGRGNVGVEEFRKIIEDGNSAEVDFSVPGHGLCLEKVGFAAAYFG